MPYLVVVTGSVARGNLATLPFNPFFSVPVLVLGCVENLVVAEYVRVGRLKITQCTAETKCRLSQGCLYRLYKKRRVYQLVLLLQARLFLYLTGVVFWLGVTSLACLVWPVRAFSG